MAIAPFRVPRDSGAARDVWIIGGNAGAAVVREEGNDAVFSLENLSGFIIEAYPYFGGGVGAASTGTKYQLVAIGDGPGWGPDYTKFVAATHRKTSYVKETAGDTLGRTEGKYLFFAGLDEAPLKTVLDSLFQQLDGGRLSDAGVNRP